MPVKLFKYVLLLSLVSGPLAGQTQQEERLWLHKAVVDDGDNLYGDRIPITAPARLLNRAWKELSSLPDPGLKDYTAVFYLFPPDGKPVTLTGALLPADDGLDNLHEAVMNVKVDTKTLARLNALDGNTLVYGVDGSGNKAWYPWKFFVPNPLFDGYYTCDGIYAYTYRPSPKLLGRYGSKAYYLNIINPGLLEWAQVVNRDNITMYMGGLPEVTLKVAWYTVSAFFAPLVGSMEKYPGMTDLHYEFRVVGSSAGGPGQIAVSVPFPLEYERVGDGYRVFPDANLFDGLKLYRDEICTTLTMLGFVDEAASVAGMDLAVMHFSEVGDVTLTQRYVDSADPVTRVDILNIGEEQVVRNVQEQYLVVTPGADDGGWSAGLLRHIEANGRERVFGVEAGVVARDWRALYDTTLYGISRVAKPPRQTTETDPLTFGPDRHFELDLQPTFRGEPFDLFVDWLSEEMQRRTASISTGQYYEWAVMEFVVNEAGNLKDVYILDSTHDQLTNMLRLLMWEATGWSPGELAGVPVKVRYRVDIGLVL